MVALAVVLADEDVGDQHGAVLVLLVVEALDRVRELAEDAVGLVLVQRLPLEEEVERRVEARLHEVRGRRLVSDTIVCQMGWRCGLVARKLPPVPQARRQQPARHHGEHPIIASPYVAWLAP